MKICPITNINSNTNLRKANNNLAFDGYKEKMYLAVRTDIKDSKTAEKVFGELFKEIQQEPYTRFTPEFAEIQEVYKKRGFKGLLEELRHPKEDSAIAKFLAKKEEDFVQVLTQHGFSIFELFNFGKFGGAKNSPYDVRAIFRNQNQKENIEFSLGKNLNLNVGTSDGIRTVDTEFYSTTGTPKVIVENYGGSQDRTFFNEDGTKPFWKNLLRGGSVTVAG